MRLPDVLDRGWTRPRPTGRQQRADVLVGIVAAVVAVVSVELMRSSLAVDVGVGGVEGYLLSAAAGLVLAVRRSLPLGVLVVESVLFVVIGERLPMLATGFAVQMVMFASLYAAWSWSRRPRLLVVTTVAVLVAMFGWLGAALAGDLVLPPGSDGLLAPEPAYVVYSLVINVVYFAGAIAWGQVSYRSARRSALIEEQRETERRLVEREQARALHDERLRIARDLHDVVAHHVSSIGVQAAGAGRVLDRDPAAARGALGTIETSSRRAVSQMHELVGLLREGGTDGAPTHRGPQPGLAELPDLAVDGVELRRVGEPFAVPATVGASLFRVAQEGVTNVRRHSGARRASLVLRYLGEAHAPARAVEVEVTDDGRGGSAGTGPDASGGSGGAGGSGGYGLRGIAERAALHGGESEIGPRPQGGFRVRVRIPVPTDVAAAG